MRKSNELLGIQICLSIVDLERSRPIDVESCTAAACPTCTLRYLTGCGQIAFESVGQFLTHAQTLYSTVYFVPAQKPSVVPEPEILSDTRRQ